MGNWFARHHLVHPCKSRGCNRGSEDSNHSSETGSLRIKVRMTAREYREFVSKADVSKGSSEVGELIMKECLAGKLYARCLSDVENCRKLSRLETVTEEEDI